jgi:hypothetical protein
LHREDRDGRSSLESTVVPRQPNTNAGSNANDRPGVDKNIYVLRDLNGAMTLRSDPGSVLLPGASFPTRPHA